MAMVEEHTFAIDGPVARYGWVNDMARPPAKDGISRLYPAKAPATSYLCVPLYWAMRRLAPRMGLRVPSDASTEAVMPTAPADRAVTAADKERWFRTCILVLRFAVVALPDFLFLVFLFRWLRRWTEDDILRLAVVTTALLGTNYLAYSQELVSHAVSAASGFAAFALTLGEVAWPARARRPGNAFLVGLLAGLPVLFEYTGGTLTLALGFFAFVVFPPAASPLPLRARRRSRRLRPAFLQLEVLRQPLHAAAQVPGEPGLRAVPHPRRLRRGLARSARGGRHLVRSRVRHLCHHPAPRRGLPGDSVRDHSRLRHAGRATAGAAGGDHLRAHDPRALRHGERHHLLARGGGR